MGTSSSDIDPSGLGVGLTHRQNTVNTKMGYITQKKVATSSPLLRLTITLILGDQQPDHHILFSTCAKFFPLPSSLQIMP